MEDSIPSHFIPEITDPPSTEVPAAILISDLESPALSLGDGTYDDSLAYVNPADVPRDVKEPEVATITAPAELEVPAESSHEGFVDGVNTVLDDHGTSGPINLLDSPQYCCS